MKKLVLFLSAGLFVFTSCNQTNNSQQDDAAGNAESTPVVEGEGIGRMEFEETVFDFGKIKEGEVVNHTFKFENTGNHPVILAQVSASCGCTTPTYTTAPVLPGKTGEIAVEFDSAGQIGQQQKIITIASNAESNITTVQLKGEVEVQ